MLNAIIYLDRFLMWRKNKKKNWIFCLNHDLTTELKFQQRGNNGWRCTAQDFLDGNEGKTETFVIRFQNVETSKAFMAAVFGVKVDTT